MGESLGNWDVGDWDYFYWDDMRPRAAIGWQHDSHPRRFKHRSQIDLFIKDHKKELLILVQFLRSRLNKGD